MASRQSVQRDLVQGEDETLTWSLTTTPWGSSPTSVVVKAYDVNDSFADVTSTVLSGSASVDGDVITLPQLTALTRGKDYKIDVKWNVGTNVFEMFFIIEAQR